MQEPPPALVVMPSDARLHHFVAFPSLGAITSLLNLLEELHSSRGVLSTTKHVEL